MHLPIRILKCPKCKHAQNFAINVSIPIIVKSNGEVRSSYRLDVSTVHVSATDECTCSWCGHTSTVEICEAAGLSK